MLERVKDFRYEEIKNWKPIVSLRESYRRENSLRNFSLIAVCVFSILFGFAFLSGWIQFSAPPEQTADTKQSLIAPPKTAQTTVANDTSSRFGQANPGLLNQTQVEKNRLATPVSGASLIGSTTDGTRHIQHTSYSDSSSLRVAVCDTETLAWNQLNRYKQQWEYEATQVLQSDQQSMYDSVQNLTKVETELITKIFEQKKRLSELEISMQSRQLLENYEQEIKPILDAVGQEYGFDVIVPARSVLAYNNAVDVTDIVAEAIRIELEKSNATGSQNRSNTARQNSFQIR